MYDLVLQIGRIRPETAVKTIINMVESGDFTETSSSEETFDNEFLASMVWSAITKNKRTSEANVMIMSRNGIVTIAGTVRSAAMAKDIDEVALSVDRITSYNVCYTKLLREIIIALSIIFLSSRIFPGQ